ncbi:MAG: response regulator, partial [Bacteroidia bacterium]|nr:response regulator [Bacteroidia bacterium]
MIHSTTAKLIKTDAMAKILIVDDNPLNIKVLCSALEGKSYQLLTATNGERALVSAERSKPDLILLDINMPGWDGYETCKRLKQNPATASIPVIFLSALDDPESKVKAFHSGGVDYLTKPFNQEEVWVRVDNHLKIAALTAELEAQNQNLSQALEEVRMFQDALFETNQALTDSIKYAQRLQNAVLSDEDEFRQLFPRSFVLHLPKEIVSGDVYYFYRRRHKTIFALADCTGHGVPGAFVSMLVTNLLSRCVEDRGLTEPASILEEIDFELKRLLKRRGDKPQLQ